MTRVRRPWMGSLLLGGLLLSACGELSPGVAAEVGSADILVSDVDEFAVGVCALRSAQTGTEQLSLEARRVAVNTLVLAEIGHRYADQIEGGDTNANEVASVLDELEPQLAELSASQRDAFLDKVRFVIEGENLLSAAIEAQIEGEANEQKFAEARAVLLTRWSEESDVEIDPRFGAWGGAELVPAASELSVPAVVEEPEADPLAGLAAGARCGDEAE